MAVKVWIGEEYEHGHEASAVATFIGNMKAAFDQETKVYHILCNFLVNGNPLDAAVVKSDGIIVLELKDTRGTVFGRENGPWYVTGEDGRHELKGGRHGNPYLQARNYRFALLELLKGRADDFLNKRPETVPFHRCVSAVVAFNPGLVAGSDIRIGGGCLWFGFKGVDLLHEEIAQRTAQGMNLTSKEMQRLIKRVLRLEEARMVENTPMRPLPEEETSAKPVPMPPEPVLEPEPQSVVTPVEVVAKSPRQEGAPSSPEPVVVLPERVRVEPALTRDASPVRCIACAVGGLSCDVAHVQGRLVAVDTTGPALVVDAPGRGEVRIVYNPALCHDVARCLELMEARLATQQRISMSFWHLGRSGNCLTMDASSIFVLEPDWLINVTDLTEVVYCPRKLLVNRYAADPPGDAAILGNAVHQAFRDVWRGGDSATCRRAVEKALKSQALALVVSSTVSDDVLDKAQLHIERLHSFAAGLAKKSIFRSETFVLSPLLGLKGRIDAVWERDGRPVMVGELKTGKSNSGEPREEHMLQVGAYAFMLIARGEAVAGNLQAILMYSGDPDQIMFTVDLGFGRLKRVMEGRNTLVRMELSGDAPFASAGNKCFPCSLKEACRHVGLLGGHKDTRAPQVINTLLPTGGPIVSDRDKTLFAHFAALLTEEFAVAKGRHALLWEQNPGDRVQDGKALALDASSPPPGEKDACEGYYTYLLSARPGDKNTSELRPGEAVLLSGSDGPMSGRTAIATIVAAAPDGLEVRMMEELVFSPAWADTYVDESLNERMFTGLFRFCANRPALKDLLFDSRLHPQFTLPHSDHTTAPWRACLGGNRRQEEAVDMSLSAQDFLLVNGPPGSGKTRLIASMVQAHLIECHRILIATVTNRALDQALADVSMVLSDTDWVRLGSPLSATDDRLRKQTVAEIVRSEGLLGAQNSMLSRPVVGGTVSSLLSGAYGDALGEFDLVIVDEATQATIPATLGAISYGKRFVLIGDPKQLPPVVQSAIVKSELADTSRQIDDLPGLDTSLFEYLWDRHKLTAAIALEDQYRMNDVICAIPSALWYEPDIRLRPANDDTRKARLKCDAKWHAHPLAALLDPSRALIFVDVDMDPEGKRTNRFEAQLVADFIFALAAVTDRLVAPLERGRKKDGCVSVAVISPYRAQVAKIRGMLVARQPQDAALWNQVVDTVDRFQGSQADVVVISLSPYTPNVTDQIANPRRLNVAMTRARHKLIILGCRLHLEESAMFAALFQKCDELIGKDGWYTASPIRLE